MEMTMLIRVAAAVLAALVLGVIAYRRKKSAI